ncbi:tRNA lysidine(34) synthetase TilS [Legionella spiritensis]|uniref:tRNA(Ile)-lysidine synthase n=1 Tax=Legionella spiritensis TaxID=452 RepID=A0A0W0YYP2_LEGSP|nr:tRNA lysidine(34) synthetase TilS [Legionella spiritensis]KTD61622.1 cell cycle protein MesJ [Legionella spiritensis]SNV39343.1 cell cycle protein MesJ [Legionella spiritensis]
MQPETGWFKELFSRKRLYVGFSGGLDSTVLLHLLATHPDLKRKLSAIHINHGLSPNAQIWELHCRRFCRQLDIPCLVKRVSCQQEANIEESARRARYQVLAGLVQENECLLMGHHLDDQAETLLLQLFRGAGIDGLAAIPAQSRIGQGELHRPLLSCPRSVLKQYANTHQLDWIDDESNEDTRFSRNFIRHRVLPLIQERWEGVHRTLARTAQHCQQAQANLQDLAELDCPALKEVSSRLSVRHLTHLAPARISNVLRTWLRQNQVRLPTTATFSRLIDEIILAGDDANPQVAWDEVVIRRYRQTLYLLPRQSVDTTLKPMVWTSFPKPLDLGEQCGVLRARHAPTGIVIVPGSTIEVRYRQGGETLFWHGQTKSLKKLMQEWQIPVWLRQRTPLLYMNNQLVMVVGYAISDHFFSEHQPDTFQINVDC